MQITHKKYCLPAQYLISKDPDPTPTSLPKKALLSQIQQYHYKATQSLT
jgi:hypothetical protein